LQNEASTWRIWQKLSPKKTILPKKNLLQLGERETQQSVARKIRYLRGKGSLGSTSLVTEENSNGSITEHTSKASIERAILQNNLSKFKQSHHRPFYKHPLVRDFQFKGTTMAASAVLAGSYDPPQDIPLAERALLQAL